MGNRKYAGEALDLTTQCLNERPVKDPGETVAGSSADDRGEQTTDAIPSYIDRERYTDTQLDMIRQRLLHPGLQVQELADRFGFNYQKLSSFLAGLRRRHEADMKTAGHYQRFLPPGNRATNSGDDGTGEASDAGGDGAREAVRQVWLEHPDWPADRVREAAGAADLSIQSVAAQKAVVMAQEGADEAEADSGTADGDSDGDGGVDDDPADVADRLERLERDVAQLTAVVDDLRTPGSDDATAAELSDDILFAVVTGEDLTDDQRREVFDTVAAERA